MSVNKLIYEGAKAMGEKRYEEAVEIYSEACQISNLENGKDEPDLMFLYGKALFENAVCNNDVLGMKEQQKQGPDEPGEDGKPAAKDEDDEANDGFQFSAAVAEDEDEDDEAEEDEEQDEEQRKQQTDASSDEEVEEAAGEEGEEQSDFEIAWEILELARIAYLKDLDSLEKVPEPYMAHKDDGSAAFVHTVSRVADIHMIMGDIGLETENFAQCVDDYKKYVELVAKIYGAGDGRYNEALFKLSLAYEFLGDEESIREAISCMREVLKALRGKAEQDPALIDDVESRISDLQQVEKSRRAEEEQLVGVLKGVVTQVKREATNDLSGLVKRKKKKEKNP